MDSLGTIPLKDSLFASYIAESPPGYTSERQSLYLTRCDSGGREEWL